MAISQQEMASDYLNPLAPSTFNLSFPIDQDHVTDSVYIKINILKISKLKKSLQMSEPNASHH